MKFACTSPVVKLSVTCRAHQLANLAAAVAKARRQAQGRRREVKGTACAHVAKVARVVHVAHVAYIDHTCHQRLKSEKIEY